MDSTVTAANRVNGEFIDRDGERFYVIHNVDKMAHFFVSMVSDSDHWLFASSTGGLTAGRVSPETALFPYQSVDKIHDSSVHTGSKTILRFFKESGHVDWEPFNRAHDGRYQINRHLYKNSLGNKLCYEEINHDLKLVFRYTWLTSESYGFVRECKLINLSRKEAKVEIIDGLQNILPAGTSRALQATSSNLVDAYKWTEVDEETGMVFFTLYSGITDRAEPSESLKANTVFCLGLKKPKVLISSKQLDNFRAGKTLYEKPYRRGIRGTYLINATVELAPQATQQWRLVANLEQSQAQVVKLRKELHNRSEITTAIVDSVDTGSDNLARIMAGSDGFQRVAQENVVLHHYANVLFNNLRGGVFNDQYQLISRDISKTVKNFNREVFKRNSKFFDSLPKEINSKQLMKLVVKQDDPQLHRLCLEYLPITFGRRHGDPSRPWNEFAINLKDSDGNQLLYYQGNWRDVFQNWEALLWSYPEYTENIIAKFVSATTIDGYNPYRITKDGIDWEVEEPDDPWSNIGYWNDHQIIYLLKLLECSSSFHPQRLSALLHQPLFSYANVPYRINSFEALLKDAKNTVEFDNELEKLIEHRVQEMGADGKLILDANGQVYQVTLLEKLLVLLLAKLGNLVIEGGIWLNTQRPEWNDANNALVGQGLSMVTLYYLRRYISFLQLLLSSESGRVSLTSELSLWLNEITQILKRTRSILSEKKLGAKQRFSILQELGQASSRYRQAVYKQKNFSTIQSDSMDTIKAMLGDALFAIDYSIEKNQRDDGMYHAYNLLELEPGKVKVRHLYLMLEGQVAALSAGVIEPNKAVELVEALFDSNVYRPDQHSFMLYPDKSLAGFLEKNVIPEQALANSPLAQQMLEQKHASIVLRDADGNYRFNASISNIGDLNTCLDALTERYGSEAVEKERASLQNLYEQVFNHQAFTGRSGGMFGFEGLGCIYWHMVSKLLLAVQENFFAAIDQDADKAICNRLGQLYYRVRKGIGFNKTPAEYGAFPADPYSHTPKHAGARQPGMTGQVKEEIVTRFGELGVRVSAGSVKFHPALLREREFISRSQPFRYLDVDDSWQEMTVPADALAFSWCQVPVVFQLQGSQQPSMIIEWNDGTQQNYENLVLPAQESSELFQRSGRIRGIKLLLPRSLLFAE